ncbi:hypothetical protein [Streptomyces sp. NPDC047028]|uniref:hypothetical protein n=1 Tax=Streptomyces sp. NPDC047028 TaxID=3155793 RepID=UPI00340BEEE7
MRKGPLAVPSLAAAAALAAGVCAVPAQALTPSPVVVAQQSPGASLPTNVTLSLKSVGRFFPEVTRVVSVGPDRTAVGMPTATVAVVYADPTGTRKVTISVDLYRTAPVAATAFQQAAKASRAVPGFTPLTTPRIGTATTGGIVTMGGETHIGIGVLDGRHAVGVTLAGYDATPANTASLVALVRAEVTAADAVLGAATTPHSSQPAGIAEF